MKTKDCVGAGAEKMFLRKYLVDELKGKADLLDSGGDEQNSEWDDGLGDAELLQQLIHLPAPEFLAKWMNKWHDEAEEEIEKEVSTI